MHFDSNAVNRFVAQVTQTKDQQKLARLKIEYMQTIELFREGPELIQARTQARELLESGISCEDLEAKLVQQKKQLQLRKREWGFTSSADRQRTSKLILNDSMPGKVFGLLTVQFRFNYDPEVHNTDLRQDNGKWQCLCMCGNVTRLRLSDLTGKSPYKSCGCKRAADRQASRENKEAKAKQPKPPRIDFGDLFDKTGFKP